MSTVDIDQVIGASWGESEALAHAVGLAVRNAVAGELPFAALVMRDGVVVGAGTNTARSQLDPSAHGEVVAIRDAARRLGTLDLSGATVYSSCEPCAICRLVALAAGVPEIVFAAGKELVPAALGTASESTVRLFDAAAAALPGTARAGRTDVDVSLPFQEAR